MCNLTEEENNNDWYQSIDKTFNIKYDFETFNIPEFEVFVKEQELVEEESSEEKDVLQELLDVEERHFDNLPHNSDQTYEFNYNFETFNIPDIQVLQKKSQDLFEEETLKLSEKHLEEESPELLGKGAVKPSEKQPQEEPKEVLEKETQDHLEMDSPQFLEKESQNNFERKPQEVLQKEPQNNLEKELQNPFGKEPQELHHNDEPHFVGKISLKEKGTIELVGDVSKIVTKCMKRDAVNNNTESDFGGDAKRMKTVSPTQPLITVKNPNQLNNSKFSFSQIPSYEPPTSVDKPHVPLMMLPRPPIRPFQPFNPSFQQPTDHRPQQQNQTFQTTNQRFQGPNQPLSSQNPRFQEPDQYFQQSNQRYFQPNRQSQSPIQTFQQPSQPLQSPIQRFQQPNQTLQSPTQRFQQTNQPTQSAIQTFPQPNQPIQSPVQIFQQPTQTLQAPTQRFQQPNQPLQSPTQRFQQPNQPAQSPIQRFPQPNQPPHSPIQRFQQPNQPLQSPTQRFQQPNQQLQSSTQRFQQPNHQSQTPVQRFQQPNQQFQSSNQRFQQPNQPFQSSNQRFQQPNQMFQLPHQRFQQPGQLFHPSNQMPSHMFQQPNHQPMHPYSAPTMPFQQQFLFPTLHQPNQPPLSYIVPPQMIPPQNPMTHLTTNILLPKNNSDQASPNEIITLPQNVTLTPVQKDPTSNEGDNLCTISEVFTLTGNENSSNASKNLQVSNIDPNCDPYIIPPTKCNLCNIAIKGENSLSRHMTIHHDWLPEKHPLIWPMCGLCEPTKLFLDQQSLDDHNDLLHKFGGKCRGNMSTRDYPFGCKFCFKRTTSRAAFMAHLETHLGIKSCPEQYTAAWFQLIYEDFSETFIENQVKHHEHLLKANRQKADEAKAKKMKQNEAKINKMIQEERKMIQEERKMNKDKVNNRIKDKETSETLKSRNEVIDNKRNDCLKSANGVKDKEDNQSAAKNDKEKSGQSPDIDPADIFICPLCNKFLHNDVDVQVHMKTAHDKIYRIPCQFKTCGMSVEPLQMKKHHQVHPKNLWPFKCHFCQERFLIRKEKIDHSYKYHPATPERYSQGFFRMMYDDKEVSFADNLFEAHDQQRRMQQKKALGK